MSARILVVEDEDRLRRVIELQLRSAGYEVELAATAELAMNAAANADLILTDLRLPHMDGLTFLTELRRKQVLAPVVIMTAFSSVETAVEAMKAGAQDFLPKPFSMDHLMTVVAKALEVRALRVENRSLRQQLGARYDLSSMVAESPAMREVLATVERVAPTRATVLLVGESGVGKDLIARALHFGSPRRDKPFVKINCTAIPEPLMESELFGYEKGAFTGAAAAKPGKFEQADTGTVFLDEIGDVPLATQVKLLRILQERELERLGSNRTRQVDVRVIAATNVDLKRAMEQGAFREDLFYRLNVMPISIPPLRERREDIAPLALRFLRKAVETHGLPVDGIAPEAVARLEQFPWPGNVRQLENVVERSALLCQGARLEANDVRLDALQAAKPAATGNGATPAFLPDGMTLDEFEQSILREALRRAGGNKSQAARMLGLTRNALRYRLTQMGIEA
ncbi:MAG: sigma-54-dependent Fis family transcriptional regulator [Bryobacterales bacterium]|nr:sigma-54-dependent Fis family transcriptional regulator [Bryobacterales bacterium]